MGAARANGSHAGEAEARTGTAEPPPVTAAGRAATRLLGDFLVREGLITQAQLAQALDVRGTEPDAGRLEDVLVAEGILSRAELEAALRRYRHRYRLGDVLLSAGAISEAQLQLAVDHHLRTGLRLGDALLQLSFLTEEELREALCRQLDVTFVDLDRLLVDRQLAPLVPKEYAQHHRVVPVASAEGTLTVAVADPTDGWVADDLQTATGCRVRLVTSTAAAFQRAFARVYGEDPAVGLSRRHHRLEQAHASVSRELEAALRGLEDLRRVHEEFLAEQAETLRSAAAEAAEHAGREGALAELRAAHAALREEHELRARAHAELASAQAAALESLTALRAEHARLQDEASARVRELAAERQRGAELGRVLAELEAAHAATRQQVDERLDALTALDAAYAEATHGLAELRAAHAALREEHERAVRELTERCEAAERRQAIAVGQLESLLARLRG